jgi:hypothetical protein
MNLDKWNFLNVTFLVSVAALLVSAKLSAEVVFRDDFTGSSVRPEWEVMGEDPDRITLDGERFLLLTTNEWRGLCYKGKLPKEYNIESKIISPPQYGTVVGLYLVESQENSLRLELLRRNPYSRKYGINFIKSLKGKESKYEEKISFSEAEWPPEENLLRINKSGINYRGYFKIEEKEGQVGREQVFLNFKERKICLLARNYEDGVPEVPVKFDYFEITK